MAARARCSKAWAIATGCECCVFGKVVFVMATVGMYAVLYALRGTDASVMMRSVHVVFSSLFLFSRLCFYFLCKLRIRFLA